ncbi:MAG TPA: glycosyltransferase family 9 protein [Chitinophagaceae bacterium]|nr:glycosyltransferase family 9 protein [Chitinophagaceae bacterium]
MKFLIIRFSSIGDIVLTTPVVRCLKSQVVTAQVHYLTKQSFAPIFKANPYIDKMHYLQDSLDALIDELKKEDFDYVIDLHHNLRTLKVKNALGKRSFSFNKLNIEKWVLTTTKWNILPDLHIVDRYMETVEPFGVQNDEKGLDYFIPDDEHVKESDIPAAQLAGYIGMVIGGAHNTKKYPVEKWKELCSRLDHPVILLGGKEDRADGDQIASADAVKIYNACGKFSLNESADLVRRAKLIVTNDTGLMHVAAAFRKPVISLWGNTVPEFGMYPYYGNGGQEEVISDKKMNRSGNREVISEGELYDIIEVDHLSCRPCSKIGYKKCPLGHFRCMRLISEESILERIGKRL